MTHKPLSIGDVLALADIVQAAAGSEPVARADKDGNITYGTARHIVNSPEDFSFVSPEVDIRDAYLRVTTTTGFECAWPVAELMNDIRVGSFARNYTP